MDNKQVRQITPEEIASQLSIEEKQKTQVLNLQEVQKTIRFEKITSKKPALLVAIIGIASIILGGSIQIGTTLHNKRIEQRDLGKDIIEKYKKEVKKLSCVKTTLNNPDGTDLTYSIAYEFENNRLNKTIKTYNRSAIPGNENGNTSISNYSKEYQALLNSSDGYSVSIVNSGNSSINVKVEIDYKYFEMTRLNEIQQTKEFTKVDYQRSATYSIVSSEMLAQGFTCE